MGEDREVDVSRRDLGILLGALGGAAGLATLASCAADPSAAVRAHFQASAGTKVEELSGVALVWVDTMVAISAVAGGTALREVTGSPRSIAVVGGHFRVGDDGGGIFYWSSGGGVDDGGTVIVPGGTVGTRAGAAGCWRRFYSGPISVKWFGATGDGSSDDAAAINAAIAAGSARQATVFFPSGMYMVSSGIRIKARLALQGDGPQWTDAPGACIRAMNRIPYVIQVAYTNVSIANMWIDGNFVADNVLEMEYPADNCNYEKLLITHALPLTTPIDVTKSNLVAVAPGSTVGIAAMNFRACSLVQDALGVGGAARSKRGHACVSNYFPGTGAGGSGNAFRWLFEGHCTFQGQQYGYRTKWGGATFTQSEFYDIEVALFAVELNQPILVLDCYTEPGQEPQSTYPRILLQEESVLGPMGANAGEINFTHCQFNTPGVAFQLNGKAPVRIDDCTINGDVIVVPARSGGATMPITVIGCGFRPGHGILDGASYGPLNYFGNFTIAMAGVPNSPLKNLKIGESSFMTGCSGAETMTDPATTAQVTFAAPQPDANYRVIVGLANASRPSAARTPYAYALSTSGFTIGLAGRMGAGQSCSVFWQLSRS